MANVSVCFDFFVQNFNLDLLFITAILLLKLVLAKVLLRYQVEPSSQKLEEIPLEYDIVQRPSVELRIRLTDRL